MRSTLLALAAASAAAAIAAAPAPAASEAAPPGRACSVPGILFGAGVEGVPVWARPNDFSESTGTLPPPDPNDDMGGRMAAEFDVVEARGGWFRIENGGPWQVDTPIPGRNVSGWISGRHVRFYLQTEVGFAQPDPRSQVRYRGTSIEPDALATLDCRGEWVKLLISDGDEVREAWFRGVCGNQETSCDMPPGDRAEDYPR